jgi:hypothetical protein
MGAWSSKDCDSRLSLTDSSTRWCLSKQANEQNSSYERVQIKTNRQGVRADVRHTTIIKLVQLISKDKVCLRRVSPT